MLPEHRLRRLRALLRLQHGGALMLHQCPKHPILRSMSLRQRPFRGSPGRHRRLAIRQVICLKLLVLVGIRGELVTTFRGSQRLQQAHHHVTTHGDHRPSSRPMFSRHGLPNRHESPHLRITLVGRHHVSQSSRRNRLRSICVRQSSRHHHQLKRQRRSMWIGFESSSPIHS